MKIRTKVILFFGTFILFVAALAVIYLEYPVYASFQKQLANNLRITAYNNERTYLGFIQGLNARTTDWTSDEYLRDLAGKIVDPNRSVASKKTFINEFSSYMNRSRIKYDSTVLFVDLVGTNNVILASTNPDRIGKDYLDGGTLSGKNIFSKTLKSNFQESFTEAFVFENGKDSDPVFRTTAQLFSNNLDSKGKPTPLPAVISVHFNSLPDLIKLFRGTLKGRNGAFNGGYISMLNTSEIYFMDKDGFIITPTRYVKSGFLKNKEVSTYPAGECFRSNRDVNEEYLDYRGVKVAGASVCLGGDGVVLITEVETGEAYMFYNDMMRTTTIVSIVIFIEAILVIFLLVRRPLNRLFQVVDTAKRVSKGEKEARIPFVGKDEIGYLAKIFNDMLDNTLWTEQSLRLVSQELAVKRAQLEVDIEEHKKQEKFLEQTSRATQNLLQDSWKAKERLQIESVRLETIISSIGDALILIDPQYKIVLVNPKAEEMFAFSADELLGKDLRSVVKLKKKGDNISIEQWPTEEMFLTKSVVVTSLEDELYISTEKRQFDLPVAFSMAPLGGGLTGAVIVIRDVSKDRALDEAKSGFISIASHQLRTPLTTIRWYSEMLLDDGEELNPSQRDFLNEIHGGSERLYQTIDLLLGISRVENGKIKPEKEIVDLTLFTEQVEKELLPQVVEKKLSFKTIPPQGQPVLVWLDALILRQVILNLLSNSIRYTNEGGTIEATWKKQNEDKPEVVYSVRDNGIGIPENQRARIFSKFFRADNAAAKVPDGSGLGLSLVQDLVTAWGGKIWFESSKEGQGTTFSFTIPLTSKITPTILIRDK